MQISLFLITMPVAILNLKIDPNNNFLKYSQIQTHQAYTFINSSKPNTQKDLESLTQYSLKNHEYSRNLSLIQFFLHCGTQICFFHFHQSLKYCLLASIVDELKYQTSTHLLCFPLCKVWDQKIMDCTNKHR